MSVIERRGGFQAVVQYKDARGKWRQRWGPKRDGKRAAEKDETQLLADRDNNKPIQRDHETVEKFLRRWLAFKATDGTAEKTLQGYRDHIETRWIPAIGHMHMTDLYANPDALPAAPPDLGRRWLLSVADVLALLAFSLAIASLFGLPTPW